KEVENETFRPDKVLEMFGDPDAAYMEVLAKATKLRQEQIAVLGQSTDSADKSVAANNLTSTGKPDLYLVSIGVSDYQQSAFDLTFADKDAIDIARIYGQLADEKLAQYRDKFFGHNFNLHRQ